MASKIRNPRQIAFLAAYAKCGIIGVSARAAEIDRRTHSDWMKKSAAYRQAFADAQEEAADSLEAEALRRARAGSDRLIIRLLEALRPDKYLPKMRHEHSGPDGRPIRFVHEADVGRVLSQDPESVEMMNILAERARRGRTDAASNN